MKILVILLCLIPSLAWATPPCIEQNYSNSKKAPIWKCPGPGESILLPDIKFNPSIGLEAGSTYIKKGSDKDVLINYDTVLMDRQKVMQLGLRIQGLRRLRWLDMHRGAEILAIEKKYMADRIRIKLELEVVRSQTYKGQRDQARKERDSAGRWYRSWTCGLVVGIVVTAGATIAVAYAAK